MKRLSVMLALLSLDDSESFLFDSYFALCNINTAAISKLLDFIQVERFAHCRTQTR